MWYCCVVSATDRHRARSEVVAATIPSTAAEYHEEATRNNHERPLTLFDKHERIQVAAPAPAENHAIAKELPRPSTLLPQAQEEISV